MYYTIDINIRLSNDCRNLLITVDRGWNGGNEMNVVVVRTLDVLKMIVNNI